MIIRFYHKDDIFGWSPLEFALLGYKFSVSTNKAEERMDFTGVTKQRSP